MNRNLKQKLVAAWVMTRFGTENQTNRMERASRLFEEATELAQAEGMSKSDCSKLVTHVFGKPAGEPDQELGGLAITMLAYAESAGLSVEDEEMRELERIFEKPIDYFQERHKVKQEAGVTVV